MEVIVKRGFLKDLRKTPAHIQEKIGDAIGILEKSKRLEESGLDYRKMSGQKKGENFYRIRTGEYRIGVELKPPSIIFITVLHRSEIYRHFP
ncbi:MAG: type II toxin-antitoxin system RelE/ParE family toxin [Ginsengibacter sp.]